MLEARLLLAADPVVASFSLVSSAHGLQNLPGGSGEYHAGGTVFTDLNNDGFADIYDPAGSVFTGGSTNQLHVNIPDGQGGRTFTRVLNDGGAGGASTKTNGAIAADYDNDGDLDIYVIEFQADNILYKNMWVEDHPLGGGSPTDLRFIDVTALTDPTPTDPGGDIQHGLSHGTFQNPDPTFGNDRLDGSLAAAWADVNRDGFIDLYVGNWDGTNGDPGTARDGQLGERDILYLNNGDGTFTDVTMGPDGVYITPPPVGISLLNDPSFESAVSGSQTSNSGWTLSTPPGSPAAVFQDATWASTDGAKGVWFQGFVGSIANPADATLSQTITAAEAGDYELTFDANVEANFQAAEFKITLSSDGTGGSDSVDLTTAATSFNAFNSYTLSLSGVTAGDQLTVLVEMVDAAVPAPGPSQSVLMDHFTLALSDGGGTPDGWEQVGGWAFDDYSFNDTNLPGEFSGLNAMQFADFNNDGWQDLIVATMGGGGPGPNRDMLYINRGNDQNGDWLGYHLASWEIGFGGNDSSEMGVTVADIDNDGDLDYYATDAGPAHSLWINQFADTGTLSFVETFMPEVFAWGTNFHDLDNNGRVDLLIGTINGERQRLHLQDTDGVMTEAAVASGINTLNAHRGVAIADYDRDGFSDIFIHNIIKTGPTPLGAELYHNDSAALNPDAHYLNITLEGDPTLPGAIKSTRDAIGARVYVTADFDGSGAVDSDETRMEEVVSGHSQAASTSSLALEFGTGKATTADIRIVWGSGREHTMTVATDQFLTFNEADLSALPGDLDGDGFVGINDLNIVLANWNQSVPPANPQADPSGDGFVGIDDLNAVLGNWNAGTPPAASSSSPAPLAAEANEADPSSHQRINRTQRSTSTNRDAAPPMQTQTALAVRAYSTYQSQPSAPQTGYVPDALEKEDETGLLGLWERE